MKLLVTDPTLGVWEKKEAGAKRLPYFSNWPCSPCSNTELAAFCCGDHRECICLQRRNWEIFSRIPCLPGTVSMCFSLCGRFLYQLSSEADCIHTRSVHNGELLFAAPTGVFPRYMMLDEAGKNLLVAGGAIAEVYLLSAPELICEKVIFTRHPCFAAAFWRKGLVLMCAEEGEDIQSVFYTMPLHGVRPQHLLTLPGIPGAICVCPDGLHMLASTCEGLLKIDLQTGTLLWNDSQWASCMRIECDKQYALISATMDGKVCLMNHEKPWERRILFQGYQAESCFLK